MEREPKAVTAKFQGMMTGTLPDIKGPFRVVLLRDGSLYRSYMCPTGQKLITTPLKLTKAQGRAAKMFRTQLEPWTECEPRKGLQV